jgi:hypothetical protein
MITATAILTETIVVTASLGGIVCQPATWTLVDEDANVLDTGSIISGGAETIIAPDGTVLRDGLPYGSVLSGGTIDVPSDTCADATIDINGLLFDTVPSGGTLDIPVLDTGANPVGSQSGTDYVIANNATYINSVQVTDQAAEQDAFIAVELDGNPSGTWNAGTQTWEVTSDPCLDGNIELNGTPVATVPSGGTEDIDVVNGGSNPVGAWDGSSWVIGNNYTEINGVQVTDQEAEVNASIAVELDGTPSGSWNAGTQTWEVTSAPCSPVTFQINAVNKESLSSGSTFNLITKLDGAVNSGSYDAPTDTLSFTSAACSPVALQINGTPQESIAAGATFNLIATLDGVAGGTYTPATDTLSFTSSGGWVRPSFWPTLPTISAATEGGNILLLVYENRLNRFTIQINHSTITWGDGTSVNVGGSTPVTTKTYTYSTLAGTVYVDAQTGENYKFVTINIVRNGAAITYVDFTASAATSPLNAPSYAVEYDLSFPNCTDFRVSNAGARDARFAKILKIWALGTLGGICRIGNTSNLRILQLPTTFVGTLGNNFARGMGAVPVGNINYGTAINCQSLFILSNIVSHGNLTANSALLLNNYLADSYSLETFGTVTANTCTNIEFAWYSCTALTSIGLLTVPVCTSYFAAFYNTQLTAIRFADSTACTNTTSMIGLCPALQLLHCPNLTRGVNFTGTSIGNYGMNIFASGDGILNGVGTASGAQTITITGTPFGALVTASDATALAIRLVLTTKGYTIAN